MTEMRKMGLAREIPKSTGERLRIEASRVRSLISFSTLIAMQEGSIGLSKIAPRFVRRPSTKRTLGYFNLRTALEEGSATVCREKNPSDRNEYDPCVAGSASSMQLNWLG